MSLCSLSLSLLKRCTRAKSIYVQLENECFDGQLIYTRGEIKLFFFFARAQREGRVGTHKALNILLYFHIKCFMMDATDAKHPDSRPSPDIFFLMFWTVRRNNIWLIYSFLLTFVVVVIYICIVRMFNAYPHFGDIFKWEKKDGDVNLALSDIVCRLQRIPVLYARSSRDIPKWRCDLRPSDSRNFSVSSVDSRFFFFLKIVHFFYFSSNFFPRNHCSSSTTIR